MFVQIIMHARIVLSRIYISWTPALTVVDSGGDDRAAILTIWNAHMAAFGPPDRMEIADLGVFGQTHAVAARSSWKTRRSKL